MGAGRSGALINGYSDGAHDDDVTDDDDVTYQPVDFCIPVGPVFNFITGQRLGDLLFSGRSALGRRGGGDVQAPESWLGPQI